MNERVVELIGRRRRQILVHSYIYYNMDESIVSDVKWNKWAHELAKLQQKWPEEAAEAPFSDKFEGFDGSTGFDLDMTDPWIAEMAARLTKMEVVKP